MPFSHFTASGPSILNIVTVAKLKLFRVEQITSQFDDALSPSLVKEEVLVLSVASHTGRLFSMGCGFVSCEKMVKVVCCN